MSKDSMTAPGTINSSLKPLGISTCNVSPGFIKWNIVGVDVGVQVSPEALSRVLRMVILDPERHSLMAVQWAAV